MCLTCQDLAHECDVLRARLEGAQQSADRLRDERDAAIAQAQEVEKAAARARDTRRDAVRRASDARRATEAARAARDAAQSALHQAEGELYEALEKLQAANNKTAHLQSQLHEATAQLEALARRGDPSQIEETMSAALASWGIEGPTLASQLGVVRDRLMGRRATHKEAEAERRRLLGEKPEPDPGGEQVLLFGG
jgi:chromosome segregation ATPase